MLERERERDLPDYRLPTIFLRCIDDFRVTR